MNKPVDCPDTEPMGPIRSIGAKTKREAMAVVFTVGRQGRMAELIQYAGTCTELTTTQELRADRRKEWVQTA